MSKPAFKLLSKISPKTVAGKNRRIPDNHPPGQPHWLFEVAGVANGTRQGESDNGPWTALVGSFMARNAITGERFRSGQCFLPNVAMNSVLGEMGEGVTGLQMAFRIGIVPSAKEPDTKYEYVAEPLLEITEDDPAAALLDKVSGGNVAQITDAKAEDKGKNKGGKSEKEAAAS